MIRGLDRWFASRAAVGPKHNKECRMLLGMSPAFFFFFLGGGAGWVGGFRGRIDKRAGNDDRSHTYEQPSKWRRPFTGKFWLRRLQGMFSLASRHHSNEQNLWFGVQTGRNGRTLWWGFVRQPRQVSPIQAHSQAKRRGSGPTPCLVLNSCYAHFNRFWAPLGPRSQSNRLVGMSGCG